MKIKILFAIIPTVLIILVSCNSAKQKDASTKKETANVLTDTLHRDSIALKETFKEDDVVYNEFATDSLKLIRQNFKRINSITKWSAVNKKDLWETTEGGEANFYYLNGVLEKIAARNYGETFQQLTEYYLLNKKLSFVFEKTYRYNRPMYYDSAAMKANNDTETFDMEKSGIIEDRSYFKNEILFHQVNNQDCGSPFAKSYLLKEQKRIKEDFNNLMKLEVQK